MNVDGSRSPVWCLGQEYAHSSTIKNNDTLRITPEKTTENTAESEQTIPPINPLLSVNTCLESNTAAEQAASITDKEEGGWPSAFLDDFEAKIWLTYRSSFPIIPRSQDPRALSAMTFSVRLRSQIVDQGGFTSDTGWGCMIRSGQSLLANAILVLRLGRGKTKMAHVKASS